MAVVTGYQTRLLEPTEYRAANTLFRACLHWSPTDDEAWQGLESSYEPGRAFGAFLDGELVGTTQSYASQLVVPGGALVPASMVSRVGVRPDHTRRGLLTELMREQLTATPDPIAVLHASEALIYGRFGYGVASRTRSIAVSRHRARPHDGAPAGGRVRLLMGDEIWKVVPDLYERIDSRRPGTLHRPAHLWDHYQRRMRDSDRSPMAAVHSGPDGDDGYVVYAARQGHALQATLDVVELQAASVAAWAGLWRYLLNVDLVGELEVFNRPLDEPVEWLLTDSRAVRTESLDDELWLRLVDVPAALDARTYSGGGEAVLEVHDRLLPHNSGCYLVSAGGVRRTDRKAGLVLDVDSLGAMYLGDVRPSTLAMVGRLEVRDPTALAVLDELFGGGVVPWTGTGF